MWEKELDIFFRCDSCVERKEFCYKVIGTKMGLTVERMRQIQDEQVCLFTGYPDPTVVWNLEYTDVVECG